MAETTVQGKKMRVEIITDRYRIVGDVFIQSANGYRSRLTDVLNQPDKTFLPLINVGMYSIDEDREEWKGNFLAVNKAGIMFAKEIHE